MPRHSAEQNLNWRTEYQKSISTTFRLMLRHHLANDLVKSEFVGGMKTPNAFRNFCQNWKKWICHPLFSIFYNKKLISTKIQKNIMSFKVNLLNTSLPQKYVSRYKKGKSTFATSEFVKFPKIHKLVIRAMLRSFLRLILLARGSQ